MMLFLILFCDNVFISVNKGDKLIFNKIVTTMKQKVSRDETKQLHGGKINKIMRSIHQYYLLYNFVSAVVL